MDVCKGGGNDCNETQIKQVILMGVTDKELIQELIGIIPTQSLDEIVQHCYALEASATISLSKSSCTVSRYKVKKAKQRSQGLSTPP